MIRTKLEISSEEISLLREIALASPVNVKKRKRAKTVSAVMTVLMLLYSIFAFLDHKIGFLIFGVIFMLFFLWILLGGVYFFQDFVYRRLQKKTDSKLNSGFREYVFDTEGVEVLSDFGHGMHKWNSFECWGVFRGYVYLRGIDRQMILVKKSSLTEGDYDALLFLLQEHLAQESLSEG